MFTKLLLFKAVVLNLCCTWGIFKNFDDQLTSYTNELKMPGWEPDISIS